MLISVKWNFYEVLTSVHIRRLFLHIISQKINTSYEANNVKIIVLFT